MSTEVPEGKPLTEFFEDWQRRERGLVRAKEGLIEQINRQNMTIQEQGLLHQNLQQAMNKSEARCRSLHSCYSQAQQACAQLNEELQDERQRHKTTRQELEFESKGHHKTERELERHYFTLNRLSEFLTMVQVSSGEGKAVVMNYFNNDHNIGNLLLDIEAKRQLIANLEYRLDIAKNEHEYPISWQGTLQGLAETSAQVARTWDSIPNHQEATEVKVLEATEIDGDRAHLPEAVVIGKGEKARTKRRASPPKTRIPTKTKI